jgi:putative RecB family exonuclease
MIYSHSRLKTYENCPRKFAFQYIEKPDIVKRDSIEAFMGSCVHDTLEQLYKLVQMERTPKWEEVRDTYETIWDKNFKDDILIVRKHLTATDYRNVGRRCLQDYFVQHFPFAESRVLGLEEKIWVDLDGTGAYKLQGFIDRLGQADDGTIEIHDYKTSQRLPSQEEVDRERQLALYQIGIEERWPDTGNVRLIWHYLRFKRAMKSKRSSESLEQLRQDTIRLIDTIHEAATRDDFPPHESMLCDWCEFNTICPAKQHLIATSGMTPEEFSADNGVKLVDRFIGAKQAVVAAQEELDLARAQIVKFTELKNLTRLQGHNFSVRVSRRQDRTIPPAKDPKRADLEAIIQATGQWDHVSDLSRSKLPKALQTDLFDPATKKRISEYLVDRELITVSTSKKIREDHDDGPDLPPI